MKNIMDEYRKDSSYDKRVYRRVRFEEHDPEKIKFYCECFKSGERVRIGPPDVLEEGSFRVVEFRISSGQEGLVAEVEMLGVQ